MTSEGARNSAWNSSSIKEATVADIEAGSWDAIIVATGSIWTKGDLGRSRLKSSISMTAISQTSIGKKVIVIGRQYGAEAACSLAKEERGDANLTTETCGCSGHL
jgi:hypothetical protein